MATLTHPKGRSVTVPDDVAGDYLSRGWTVVGAEPKTEPKPKRGRQAKPKRDDDADHGRADHAVPEEPAGE